MYPFVIIGSAVIIIWLLKKWSSSKRVLAIDTEMVGGGYNGSINMLARVSIVDRHSRVIYDEYVIPSITVTDYRTPWSGIREEDLLLGANKSFNLVKQEVQRILQNCILVGHDVQFDLRALNLAHPSRDLRDTALGLRGYTISKPSLKFLAKKFLNQDIQFGEHCSVEDARAAMDLYLLVEKEWEKEMA